jgi:hypothetical protein
MVDVRRLIFLKGRVMWTGYAGPCGKKLELVPI